MITWLFWLSVGIVLIFFLLIPLVSFTLFLAAYLTHQREITQDIRDKKNYVKELIKADGLIKVKAAGWISQILLNNPKLGKSRLVFLIRSKGKEISERRKKKIGVHLNTKIGKQYYKSLTAKGIDKPVQGAIALVDNWLRSKSKSGRNIASAVADVEMHVSKQGSV